MDNKMNNLGFTDRYIREASFHEGLFLGRVVSQYKYLYSVANGKIDLMAEVAGKLH